MITKLRSSSNNPAEDHVHQNWKAAKALLVIIPLLGITYLITITGPTRNNHTAYLVFMHARAFLLSIQVAEQPETRRKGHISFFTRWI